MLTYIALRSKSLSSGQFHFDSHHFHMAKKGGERGEKMMMGFPLLTQRTTGTNFGHPLKRWKVVGGSEVIARRHHQGSYLS